MASGIEVPGCVMPIPQLLVQAVGGAAGFFAMGGLQLADAVEGVVELPPGHWGTGRTANCARSGLGPKIHIKVRPDCE